MEIYTEMYNTEFEENECEILQKELNFTTSYFEQVNFDKATIPSEILLVDGIFQFIQTENKN